MRYYEPFDPQSIQPCICECCGWDVESKQGCQCPECPECGEQGNPNCYREICCGGHGMEYNEIQRWGISKRREMDEEDRIEADMQMKAELWTKATCDKGL